MDELRESVDDVKESRLRSVLKALTYRITGTVTTTVITLAVTGELVTALAVGAIEPAVKVAVYYAHERAWQQIPRGSVRHWLELNLRRRRE